MTVWVSWAGDSNPRNQSASVGRARRMSVIDNQRGMTLVEIVAATVLAMCFWMASAMRTFGILHIASRVISGQQSSVK